MTTKKEAKRKRVRTLKTANPRKPKVLAVEAIRPEALTVVVEAHPEQIEELLQHKDAPQTFFEKLSAWWNE
jgi:hypothetical protein